MPGALLSNRLLNIGALLSVALCAAVLVLWTRSYRTCDALVRPSAPGDRVCITSEFGVLVFEVEGPLRGSVLPTWEYFDTPLPRRWPVRAGRFGFDAYRGQVSHFVRLPPSEVWGVAIPHAWAAVTLAALPAWALVRRRRRLTVRRRREQGLCAGCGYDLRATPGQCPECGLPGATAERRDHSVRPAAVLTPADNLSNKPPQPLRGGPVAGDNDATPAAF
ncbi:MAG TPA: hypothetical protein VFY65_13255 [Longimicrobium sp.]|nr:hypothetical protein [Longimicrobium sp.]